MQSFPEDIDALCDLARSLRDGDSPVRVVEVGTWVGATACRLADAGCAVTCIDWFRGQEDPADTVGHNRTFEEMYGQFRHNVADRLWRRVFPVVGQTTGVEWVQGPFDLAFIDADHRYECARADIERWAPCVRPGGIVACHDYGLWPGVTQAVKELRGGEFTVAGKSLAWWRV